MVASLTVLLHRIFLFGAWRVEEVLKVIPIPEKFPLVVKVDSYMFIPIWLIITTCVSGTVMDYR